MTMTAIQIKDSHAPDFARLALRLHAKGWNVRRDVEQASSGFIPSEKACAKYAMPDAMLSCHVSYIRPGKTVHGMKVSGSPVLRLIVRDDKGAQALSAVFASLRAMKQGKAIDVRQERGMEQAGLLAIRSIGEIL